MKTKLNSLARAAGLAVLISACAASVQADDKMAANEKTSTGTITALDAKEKVLKTEGLLFTKTFVLGDNCTLAVGSQTDASLNEFRPGQKVTVDYRDVDGVLVADRVTQDRLYFTGEVSAIDAKSHVLTLRHRAELKTFGIADNCGVTLSKKSSGSLDDIKPGNHVTVIYEKPGGKLVIQWIEQPSLQFTGTLGTVDLTDRTITAGKRLLGDKQFHVGDNCAVVINGKVAGAGHLKDLRPGENCELSYDTVDGVNIVNRIALVSAPGTTETSAPVAGN
jgi:Cu/Ag efflux protein CusF